MRIYPKTKFDLSSVLKTMHEAKQAGKEELHHTLNIPHRYQKRLVKKVIRCWYFEV